MKSKAYNKLTDDVKKLIRLDKEIVKDKSLDGTVRICVLIRSTLKSYYTGIFHVSHTDFKKSIFVGIALQQD